MIPIPQEVAVLLQTLDDIHIEAHCISLAGPLDTPTLQDAWPKFDRIAAIAATAYADYLEKCKASLDSEHAPPPAPSCPTEQGELVDSLEQEIRSLEANELKSLQIEKEQADALVHMVERCETLELERGNLEVAFAKYAAELYEARCKLESAEASAHMWNKAWAGGQGELTKAEAEVARLKEVTENLAGHLGKLVSETNDFEAERDDLRAQLEIEVTRSLREHDRANEAEARLLSLEAKFIEERAVNFTNEKDLRILAGNNSLLRVELAQLRAAPSAEEVPDFATFEELFAEMEKRPGYWKEGIALCHDHIKSLEAELRAASDDQAAMAMQLRELRAAPSAVAKDRAELERNWLFGRLEAHLDSQTNSLGGGIREDITDAISLLSQPAVAQTDSLHDMTARESFFERHIRRLAQDYRRNAPSRQWMNDVADELEAILSEAPDSVLSESSPKSGSVPAVAGGGEDGERLDWLMNPKCNLTLLCLYPSDGWFNFHGPMDATDRRTHRERLRELIDVQRAAIAATKAKEGKNL